MEKLIFSKEAGRWKLLTPKKQLQYNFITILRATSSHLMMIGRNNLPNSNFHPPASSFQPIKSIK
ncbi:hypothetical protein [Chryseobacterium sp. OV279]|uniref:hypothetical protein n=1 Tax=Chryseobacterium sp. OV279 TaxID=1500285 RepID=UPI0009321155|nr:hypothetical protein [Chryseobacterium sp. OV279]